MLKRKGIIYLVVGTLALTLMLFGCKKTTDNAIVTSSAAPVSTTAAASESSPGKIVQDKITLTYWVSFGGWEAKTMKNLAEKGAYQALEEITNVHIEFLHPATGQEAAQFNLLIASNDLPDIIEGYVGTYPGGPDKAVSDGYYLKLNDYIKQYAPNYNRLRTMESDIAAQTISDEGNIWAFYCLQPDDEVPWYGMLMRQDWLDELGLQVPETIDEWYTVLKAFKGKKGVEYPLQWHPGALWGGMFISAYGIGPDFYQENGKVKYGYNKPEFKDLLIELNKWYKEGLLDKDYATRDNKSRDEMIINDKTGAYTNDGWPLYLSAIVESGKGSIVAAPYPTLKKGSNVRFRQADFHNKGSATVITTACKYPIEAVKWFDYHYSEEGFMLFNYGIEGKSYTLEDGKLDMPEVWSTLVPNLWNSGKVPTFTKEMTNSSEGFDFYTSVMRYKVHVGPYMRYHAAIEKEPDFFHNARYNTWFKAGFDMVMPPVSQTLDEGTRLSDIMVEVNTYYTEMLHKYIMGLEPISSFDKYVDRIGSMGIEEAIKIKQSALDRYNKR